MSLIVQHEIIFAGRRVLASFDLAMDSDVGVLSGDVAAEVLLGGEGGCTDLAHDGLFRTVVMAVSVFH